MKNVISTALTVLLVIAFFTVGGLTGYAFAGEMVKGMKVKPIDNMPGDYADPYKYNPNRDNRSPEGVQWAATGSRTHELQETYTKLNFSMDKVFGDIKAAKGSEKCLNCHKGIEEISDNHAFACTKCHSGNGNAADAKGAHAKMVSNPSDLMVADKFCGSCHKDHVGHVGGSLMSTAAGEINSTRYVWGAQKSPDAKYGTKAVNGLKAIPTYGESKQLVDDFLRKKCVRCHINSPAPNRQGEYRATGCAACHMIYSNDGKTKTGDKAIAKAAGKKPEKIDLSGIGPMAKRGYPIVHKFTAAVPTVQCVRCHSGNRAGTEYLGMAEHDYEKMYRSPRDKGGIPPAIFGIEQHFLKADIHYEKGMACIDCHTQSEVEGDGKSYNLAHEAVKVRCQSCHGTPGAKPKTKALASGDKAIKASKSNPNYSAKAGDRVAVTSDGTPLANVKMEGGKLVLTSKVTGKKHTVPLLADLAKQPVNHQVAEHMEKMECHSCHARFSAQDYGLHLMREDYNGFKKWKRWREPDPNVELVLFSTLGNNVGDKVKQNKPIWGMKSKDVKPETIDWLTGKKSLGVWYSAWSVRNWEDVVLGYNSRGKISIFKPQYQYFVSHMGTDYMNAKKKVDEIKKKIAVATTEKESLALKRELVQAEKTFKAQMLKDSEVPRTGDGKSGMVMNPTAPHTTRTAVRRCEQCHQNGNAAGLGQTKFLSAKKQNVPLMENDRMGLAVDFQLSQMVAENGDVLQTSTHKGARPFKTGEIKSLMGKSKTYRAMRYLDLAEGNYLTIKDRGDLPGGAKREVIPGTSNGDVREVGSYYDWKRYGFWQTDPAVFKDEYFTTKNPKKMKKDFSKDRDIRKEKKGIEETSGTVIDKNSNLNWVPEE